jgi:hypothetical protein
MIWRIDIILLDDRVKVFYNVRTSPLNSFLIVAGVKLYLTMQPKQEL